MRPEREPSQPEWVRVVKSRNQTVDCVAAMRGCGPVFYLRPAFATS